MKARRSPLARTIGVAAALTALAFGFVAAPPASAADLGTVSWNGSAATPSAIPSASTGDTFTFYNGHFDTIELRNATGELTQTGATCDGMTGNCAVIGYTQKSFTITTTGTISIIAGSDVVGTLTLGSSGGGSPTAAELPGAPTNLKLTAGNRTITASWSAPASSGSDPINRYQVVRTEPGNGDSPIVCVVPASQTSCTFDGTNGSLTTVEVIANNAQGWGPPATGTVTPTASATCSNLTIDVAQPSSGAVTAPVGPSTTVASMPYIAVPYGGSVKTAAIGTYTPASETGSMGGDYATFTPQATGSCFIDVTAPTGARLSLTVPVDPTGGSQYQMVGPGQSVYVFGTKTGTYDLGVKAGNETAKPRVRIGTPAAAAYSLTANPTTQTLPSGAFGSVDFTVNDGFGNPVPGVVLNMSASGETLLYGSTRSGSASTDSNGRVTQIYVASNQAGTGVISATGATANNALAWVTGYTKPATFTATSNSSASVAVTVEAQVDRTIAIVGFRGEADTGVFSGETCRSYTEGPPVRSLPAGCVKVEGVTSGLAEGTEVTPEYRFPGQTNYTQGIPVTVDANGEFDWYRKTGKKIYVRFVFGDVVSSRVIIPAK